MIEQYLELLGINHNSTLDDVKKAYRKLAKENHPDHFLDKKEKKLREMKMVQLNEAYSYIITNFKDIKLKSSEDKVKEAKLETDYDIYKKGYDFYSKYCRANRTEEKIKNLKEAKAYFIQLIKEYPDSDWAYDAEEKLKNIGSIIDSSRDLHYEYSQKRGF